jgi:hypothetical protein
MEKIFLLGLILISIIGAGAVGTVVTSDNNYGMIDGHYGMMGEGNGHMMDVNDMQTMHEECEEHLDEDCDDMTEEECGEVNEECEEYMDEYCEHDEHEHSEYMNNNINTEHNLEEFGSSICINKEII